MNDVRATTKEFLDQPDCDPSLAAASYRFMELVNGCFGGTRIVRRFPVGRSTIPKYQYPPANSGYRIRKLRYPIGC